MLSLPSRLTKVQHTTYGHCLHVVPRIVGLRHFHERIRRGEKTEKTRCDRAQTVVDGIRTSGGLPGRMMREERMDRGGSGSRIGENEKRSSDDGERRVARDYDDFQRTGATTTADGERSENVGNTGRRSSIFRERHERQLRENTKHCRNHVKITRGPTLPSRFGRISVDNAHAIDAVRRRGVGKPGGP